MNQQDLALSASVTVSGNIAHVVLGEIDLTFPVQQLDPLIRTLEGCRLIAQSISLQASETGEQNPWLQAPEIATQSPVANRSPLLNREASKPKRRSRKRVGDALVVWMRQNPGWHSEDELLDVVIHHEMTDASPKRALKIALGKQRGDLFLGDGQGNWKLREEVSKGSATGAREGTEKPSSKRGHGEPLSSKGMEKRKADTQTPPAVRRNHAKAVATSIQEKPLLDSKGPSSSVVRRRKTTTTSPALHSSRDSKRSEDLAEAPSNTSVKKWNRSFSRNDVDRARRN